ncbi:MAG: AMP-binding protein [bacterium]|nr:AMP-binding protein [bacterium]
MKANEPTAAAQPWVAEKTIGEVFAATVDRFGSNDAFVFAETGERMTWLEFDNLTTQVAKALLAAGIGRGDHIAVWATNISQWVALQFGAARIGVVLVTVNPAYRAFELKYVLQQSDAAALFLIDCHKSSDYHAMLGEICPDLASRNADESICVDLPKLRRAVSLRGKPPAGLLAWDAFLNRSFEISDDELAVAEQATKSTDPINIQYTSGTTGFPKAAALSHSNLLMNAWSVGDCQRITSDDRICIPVPFYHCFGCVMGTLCCAVYGATMVIPAESFRPEATLVSIATERASVIYGVPTMFIAVLADAVFEKCDLSSLRTGIMAGSPCPISIMRQVINDMHCAEMTIAYGQTEASPVVTQTRTNDPIELRVETVGRPLPGVEVKIVDPDSGKTLPDNEQGELCSRGHGVMIGYYNDPAATKAAIDDAGWLHSGDLAVRLPNGYYRITGRLKDMVIRGGENIYPREIEEFLFTHDAIESAAVVGVPDIKFGEELCAWVKLKAGVVLTAKELREFCHDSLAHYKTPKHIRFVDSFPCTATGKVQKYKIRETMIADLQLDEPETA